MAATTEPRPRKMLAVFDFDWTIVNDDSDTFLFDALSPDLHQKCNDLHKQVQWTDLMDQLVGELHSKNFTKAQIIDAFKSISFLEGYKKLIPMLHEHADIYVLSDANVFYIDTILTQKGLRHYFKGIISNPVRWEGDRLRIERLHKTNVGCDRCAVNICKSMELRILRQCKGTIKTADEEDNQHSESPYSRILYIGDGRNDFCPTLSLSDKDWVFPRKGLVLDKLITEQRNMVKANIGTWSSVDELIELMENAWSTQ